MFSSVSPCRMNAERPPSMVPSLASGVHSDRRFRRFDDLNAHLAGKNRFRRQWGFAAAWRRQVWSRPIRNISCDILNEVSCAQAYWRVFGYRRWVCGHSGAVIR